jgi:hypothetical protein
MIAQAVVLSILSITAFYFILAIYSAYNQKEIYDVE